MFTLKKSGFPYHYDVLKDGQKCGLAIRFLRRQNVRWKVVGAGVDYPTRKALLVALNAETLLEVEK
jgi:hypothetical protein